MFCPGCGLEEIQSNQFCRACGSDMRVVRTALERPDNITASAVSARDEIGRAIAAKIRETKSVKELAVVTEEVLPQIEKFLESPEEKRLRRMRVGTVTASIGVGAAVAFAVTAIALKEEPLLLVAGLGLFVFFIGLSFILNGLFSTIPKKTLPERSSGDAGEQRELNAARLPTNELSLPESNAAFPSVTEHTTRHLK